MPAKKKKSAVTVPAEFPGFSENALRFLSGLKRYNTKEWFEKNRDVYEQEIRIPMLALIEEMDVRLAGFAPEIVGNSKSMFRIHRDVRFSKDKSPYKTHAACWFYHRDAGRAVGENAANGGAGFYFHFEPRLAFSGGGIWMPPRQVLLRIRLAIAEAPEVFRDILEEKGLSGSFGALESEGMLKRMPTGFAADHRAGDLLRYKSFTVGRSLTESDVLSPKLPDILEQDFRTMLPLIRWLNSVSGLRESRTR